MGSGAGDAGAMARTYGIPAETDKGAASGARIAMGRSGRSYAMTPLPGTATVEGEDVLYALHSGTSWGWVGSAHDLIDSPESRARFRALAAAGAALYRLGTVADPLERMTIAWDIETTEARRRAA